MQPLPSRLRSPPPLPPRSSGARRGSGALGLRGIPSGLGTSGPGSRGPDAWRSSASAGLASSSAGLAGHTGKYDRVVSSRQAARKKECRTACCSSQHAVGRLACKVRHLLGTCHPSTPTMRILEHVCNANIQVQGDTLPVWPAQSIVHRESSSCMYVPPHVGQRPTVPDVLLPCELGCKREDARVRRNSRRADPRPGCPSAYSHWQCSSRRQQISARCVTHTHSSLGLILDFLIHIHGFHGVHVSTFPESRGSKSTVSVEISVSRSGCEAWRAVRQSLGNGDYEVVLVPPPRLHAHASSGLSEERARGSGGRDGGEQASSV